MDMLWKAHNINLSMRKEVRNMLFLPREEGQSAIGFLIIIAFAALIIMVVGHEVGWFTVPFLDTL